MHAESQPRFDQHHSLFVHQTIWFGGPSRLYIELLQNLHGESEILRIEDRQRTFRLLPLSVLIAYSRMLVSTNRTVVDILAIQTVAGSKGLDRFDGPLLQPFTPFEVALAFGELDQKSAHQRRNRSLLLRRPDTSASMDLIRDCDCDIFHLHIITGADKALKRVNHRNRTPGNGMVRSSPSDKAISVKCHTILLVFSSVLCVACGSATTLNPA